MIKQGDCLELMKDLPDGSVDMIATDPPYCVGATSNGTRASFDDFNLMRPFWKECFSEWQRILKDGAHIYLCTDWRTYPFLYPILDRFFTIRNLIVWDYGWLKCGSFYRFRHELIIFATKGKSKRTFESSNDNCDVWRIKCINFTSPNKLHQAQKPIELMEKMIVNSSAEGDTVLDPFAGSGSTGVACVNTDRRFIGFELDEHFFNVADERIKKAIAQKEQSLF